MKVAVSSSTTNNSNKSNKSFISLNPAADNSAEQGAAISANNQIVEQTVSQGSLDNESVLSFAESSPAIFSILKKYYLEETPGQKKFVSKLSVNYQQHRSSSQTPLDSSSELEDYLSSSEQDRDSSLISNNTSDTKSDITGDVNSNSTDDSLNSAADSKTSKNNEEAAANECEQAVSCKEVYISRIPRDCLEDELIPVLEIAGNVMELRLMMDHEGSGDTRGYGFCVYSNKKSSEIAVKVLDGFQIRPGRLLSVTMSRDNRRLYLGGVPRHITRQEIYSKMSSLSEELRDVIIYPSMLDRTINRGFAFMEYNSHAAAAKSRKKLTQHALVLWGRALSLDWAVPEMSVSREQMQVVKVVFLRKLTLDTSEEQLRELFLRFGEVKRVKKIKDFAFVHLDTHEATLEAVRELNGSIISGSTVEVSLSKPVDRQEYRRWKETKHSTPIITSAIPIPYVNGGIPKSRTPPPRISTPAGYFPSFYTLSPGYPVRFPSLPNNYMPDNQITSAISLPSPQASTYYLYPAHPQQQNQHNHPSSHLLSSPFIASASPSHSITTCCYSTPINASHSLPLTPPISITPSNPPHAQHFFYPTRQSSYPSRPSSAGFLSPHLQTHLVLN